MASKDIYAIYQNAKARHTREINNLGGSKAEAENMQRFFNQLSSLGGHTIGQTESKEKNDAYSDMLRTIEQILGVKLEKDLLLLSEDERAAALQIKEKINKEKTDLIKVSQSGTIAKAEADRILKRMKIIYENTIKGRRISSLSAAEQEFKECYQKLKVLSERATLVAKGRKATSGGGGYTVGRSTAKFAAELNRMNNLISTSAIAEAQGDIGELFSAMALAAYYNQSGKSISDILASFSQKGGGNVQIIGDETSKNLYYSEEINLGNGLKISSHATQDKVDVIITDNSSNQPITFSVKNYANTSRITLLKGKMAPLFNQYVKFMQHYQSLIHSARNRENVINLAKNIAAFKALSGGILVANKDGNIIQQGKAQYLIVNDSGKKGAFRIYSIGEIAKDYLQADQDSSQIFKIDTNFSFANPPSYNKIATALNTASAHISMLLSSLKTNE